MRLPLFVLACAALLSACAPADRPAPADASAAGTETSGTPAAGVALAALPLAVVPNDQDLRGLGARPAGEVPYEIDLGHSQVLFMIKHMGISTVTGRFDAFAGTVRFDPENPDSARIDVTIQTASLDTNSPARDAHLQAPEWFDGAAHPTITFRGRGWRRVGPDRYEAPGTLTMKGVSRPVTLDVAHNGSVPAGVDGRPHAGFDATTVLDRTLWGVGTTTLLPGNVRDLAEEVRIVLEIDLAGPPSGTPSGSAPASASL